MNPQFSVVLWRRFMDSYEADELGKYTSLSSLAVCAFLLGLASIVALLAPLFVVVPIAGMLVSLLALLRINTSDGALSGAKLAYAALILCVVCAVASPLRVRVRDALYKGQADGSAREWLQLVAENETQQSLNHLTGNARMMLMGPPSPEGPPPVVDPQSQAIKLALDPLVTKLQEEAKHGQLEFATHELSCDSEGTAPRVAALYQTVKPDDSLTMRLVLMRSVSPGRGGEWLIDSWHLEGETAHDHAHSHDQHGH
jgi:hypothetical protein